MSDMAAETRADSFKQLKKEGKFTDQKPVLLEELLSGPLCNKAMAAAIGKAPSDITEARGQLAKKGLIEHDGDSRIYKETGRRVIWWRITARGIAKITQTWIAPSRSHPGENHVVSKIGKEWSCTCGDHFNTQLVCFHIAAKKKELRGKKPFQDSSDPGGISNVC